jgi:cell division septum initiation protein DivIVA
VQRKAFALEIESTKAKIQAECQRSTLEVRENLEKLFAMKEMDYQLEVTELVFRSCFL